MLVKTLSAEGKTFLMLYEPPAEPPADPAVMAGDLWPYKVTGNAIEFTRIADSAVAEMEKISTGLVEAEATGGAWTFTIKKLDEPTLAALLRISAVPELWTTWARGEKLPPL